MAAAAEIDPAAKRKASAYALQLPVRAQALRVIRGAAARTIAYGAAERALNTVPKQHGRPRRRRRAPPSPPMCSTAIYNAHARARARDL